MVNNKNYLYIAFDSDIFSSLADALKLRDPSTPEYLKRKLLKSINDIENIDYLLDKIIAGEIRPVVVNTVFNEVSLVPHIAPFLKKFGYFPKTTKANRLKKREQVKDLAKAYCESADINGKTSTPPMKKAYNAYADEYTPSNDAIAMAEATIENCIFVTGNGKDFIFYGKDSDNTDRSSKIIAINIKKGYCTIAPNGFAHAPKPSSLKDFLQQFKKFGTECHYVQPNEEPVPENTDFLL